MTRLRLRNAALSDWRTVVVVLVGLPLVVLAFAGTTGLAKYAVLWRARLQI